MKTHLVEPEVEVLKALLVQLTQAVFTHHFHKRKERHLFGQLLRADAAGGGEEREREVKRERSRERERGQKRERERSREVKRERERSREREREVKREREREREVKREREVRQWG